MQVYDNYFITLLRKQKYGVDAAEIRKYFTYDKTRAGIFQLMHDLFGADIRPWKDAPVWDNSVSAWELFDGDKLIGRFYLDMHPREGKYNHAAEFPVFIGAEGRTIPLATLVCNFPASGPMMQSDATTFLHEFGHLIHALYSGHNRYAMQDMDNLPHDFVEAPSQLLEEWLWDYDTLKTFATDDAGNPIPEALVKKMNTSRQFAAAIGQKVQLALSAISLNYYNRVPGFDLQAQYATYFNKFSSLPELEDAHSYASFGHLDGYGASYYTYVWDKAIALDLFSQFKAAGLHNRDMAQRYRKLVLEPGSSQDANELMENFLSRPLSLDAYKNYLQKTD
jgi:thimet oligopeptidase